MATIMLSTNNSQFIHLFENLAEVLNVPVQKVEETDMLSKSMQKALEDERKGRVTKLINHKNAVAEILKIPNTIIKWAETKMN
jgi:hypothetical protein